MRYKLSFKKHKSLYLSELSLNQFIGSGLSTNKHEASLKAQSEAIERYCMAKTTPDLTNISYAEIKSGKKYRLLPIKQLKPFTEKQYKTYRKILTKINPNKEVDWALFDCLTSEGLKYALPFDYCTFTTEYRDVLFFSSSSGNATHHDRTTARLSSILELIERDATSFYWWTNTPPLKITDWWDYINDKKFKKSISTIRKNINIYTCPTDLNCHTLVATYTSERKKPYFATSSAAHLCPRIALNKALNELVQSILIQKYNKSSKNELLDYEKTILTFQDHTNLFAHHPNLKKIIFSMKKKSKKFNQLINFNHQTPKANLYFLVQNFRHNNFILLQKDISEKSPRKNKNYTFRSYSPNLAQLDAMHAFRQLGMERYKQLSKKMKIKQRGKKLESLNQMPHPFP
jgi:ribosomal protein S12 methylthiotransferase accessory factor